jgi:hypothetical protein
VPLFVTLGSRWRFPSSKRNSLRIKPIAFPVNVATYGSMRWTTGRGLSLPVRQRKLSLTPAIVSKTNVRNSTSNAHGISGYLGDRRSRKGFTMR